MRFIKPLDKDLLHGIFKKFNKIITIEDGTLIGGFGSAITEFCSKNNYKKKILKNIGIPDKFVTQGSLEELFKKVGLDEKSIKVTIEKLLKE